MTKHFSNHLFVNFTILILSALMTITAAAKQTPQVSEYVWSEAFSGESRAAAFRANVFTQDWTYNQPTYLGDRLDWCLTWGAGCGKQAAVAFCNRRRFEDVVVFRAEVVGKSARTRLFGSNEVCNGHDFCTAFAYITCTKPIPTNRVFANPVWKGHRLDSCLQWGNNCGKPAADAFCKAEGFSESLDAAMDQTAGRGTTRLIGTDQICDKPFCVGFQQIICK